MPSKVILVAFVFASIVALGAALKCYESQFDPKSNQPTSDKYKKEDCPTNEKYCLKWTSKDFNYAGRGCFSLLRGTIGTQTGNIAQNVVVPDCSKTNSLMYNYTSQGAAHVGNVYCCGKDLCNGAAFGAPTLATLATLFLGVVAAIGMKM